MPTTSRWTGVLGAALLAFALGGCAQMEPRLWVPDEVKQQMDRIELTGVIPSRSGETRVDGRLLQFQRSAATTNWLGLYAGGSGYLRFDIEGEPAVQVECRSDRADMKLFGLHLAKPLTTNCQVQQGDAHSELRLWTQPMARASDGEELRGEWTLADGQRLFIYSEHRNPAGSVMGHPLGFSVVQQGRAVAWVDVSHWHPRMFLPRGPQRQQVMPVAALLALLMLPPSP